MPPGSQGKPDTEDDGARLVTEVSDDELDELDELEELEELTELDEELTETDDTLEGPCAGMQHAVDTTTRGSP
jgi:hypothetical protein